MSTFSKCFVFIRCKLWPSFGFSASRAFPSLHGVDNTFYCIPMPFNLGSVSQILSYSDATLEAYSDEYGELHG